MRIKRLLIFVITLAFLYGCKPAPIALDLSEAETNVIENVDIDQENSSKQEAKIHKNKDIQFLIDHQNLPGYNLKLYP